MHKNGTRFLFSSPLSLVPKGKVQFASIKRRLASLLVRMALKINSGFEVHMLARRLNVHNFYQGRLKAQSRQIILQ